MDERFLKEEGLEVFTGNELVVKGALEAQVSLITGYPGSPVSDIFDVAFANRDYLKSRGILAEMSNNEALAVARLNGSRMAGVRAMAVMKSVGLHVAADGLALGNLSEPNNDGGSIVVVGDDPWIDSTQINNDSRFLSQHLHMPVLEPSTFQEIKDWVNLAFELSSRSNLYLTYLITTHQADGGGTVWLHPNRFSAVNTQQPIRIETDRIPLDTQVLLPPRTWTREATLPTRFDVLLEEVRRRNINALTRPAATFPLKGEGRDDFKDPALSLKGEGARRAGEDGLGFISSGLPYCYLEHALSELGLSGRFPILKLGLTYPVDPQAVLELASQVDTLYVVEEKRGFVEAQVVKILHDAHQAGALPRPPRVWGKRFPNGAPGFPETRGLNASLVAQRLITVFLELSGRVDGMDAARLRAEQAMLEAADETPVKLPLRTPTFCPGCPHRDSSSVFLQIKKDFMDPSYMKRTHGRAPVDLLFHGETGCFTMLMFEPNKPLMHNYSGMGLGGGTGAGADPFITNKQVVFLGDSTFFHSGMIAISDSIKNAQDITYVILDNKTTAMTGHQPTPGTEINLMGERTFAQNIEDIVRGMAGQGASLTRINPEARDSYRQLLEDTVLQDGVKVVIADKECGLTYHRRQRKEKKLILRRQGYLPEEQHVNVTPEVCEYCLECTRITGCPGLTIEETLYGPKIATDLSACVSDGACAKVKACPSFEEVIVKRKKPRQALIRPAATFPLKGEGRDDFNDPALALQGVGARRAGEGGPAVPDPFYIFTAGVGGMGAGLLSAVLVRAAQRDGYRVLFSDKKGLAIRNGGVYAHVVLSKSGGALAPLVPYGKADLLLGIDVLEAARSVSRSSNLRVAGRERTAVVVNTANRYTVRMLMGDDPLPGPLCETALRAESRPDAYWGADVSAVSEQYFESKLYANVLLLGVAFQRGHLPMRSETMEWAIAQSVPKEDRQVNLEAFRAGRLLAIHPERFPVAAKAYTYASLLEEKTTLLRQAYGERVARDYRFLVEEAVLNLGLDDATHLQLAQRAYDLVHYDSLALAEQFVERVLRTAGRDRREWRFQATQAVLRNAFKVTAIKDEVYVAHLLTSPEKRARDRARYRVDASRGDRIVYRHLNRPEFTLFGRSFRWDMTTRDWQLNLMKRMKFLRRWLPQWHRAERDFRDWYLNLVDQFNADSEETYRVWVEVLCCPETVNGYRDIRRPKMEEARRKAERLFNESSSAVAGGGRPQRPRGMTIF